LQPSQAAELGAAFLRDTTENVSEAAQQAAMMGYAAYAPAGTGAMLRNHLA